MQDLEEVRIDMRLDDGYFRIGERSRLECHRQIVEEVSPCDDLSIRPMPDLHTGRGATQINASIRAAIVTTGRGAAPCDTDTFRTQTV